MADERIESVLNPAGGINQDDSLISPPNRQSAFEQGDYLYARNLRIGSTTSGNLGAAETIPSTLLVNNYYTWNGSAWIADTAPAGNKKVRGRFEDKDEGAIYSAVYNDSGNHIILKFVKSERRIYEICKWTGWNFDANKWISMTKINNYLIFTEGVNPPRCINVTTISALRLTLGANFSEYHVSFAKWPPLAPPTATTNGTAITNSQLTKGLFQFSYKYIYIGGLKSTWSPPSSFYSLENALAFTTEGIRVNVPGFIANYETGVYFQHDSVKFYDVVQYIEFAYRQSTTDPWKLFKRLTVDTATPANNLYADFVNAGPQATIADSDIGQYFDAVPFFAGACEAVDNRTMFANNTDELATEAFAVTNIDVYSTTDIFTDSWAYSDIAMAPFTGLGATDKSILYNKINLSKYSFKEGGIYKLGIIFQHASGRTGLVQTADNWTYYIPRRSAPPNLFGTNWSGTEYMHALGFKIDAAVKPPIWAQSYQIVRTNCLNIEFFIYGIVNDFALLKADTQVVSERVSTPTAVQDIINQYGSTGVSNDPSYPLSQRLANYWRKSVVVAGATASTGSQIYIDIENWANSSGTALPGNNIYYNFQKGDRVRFKANPSGTTATIFDVEIADYTGKGLIVNIPDGLTSILTRGTSALGLQYQFTVEVYRPKAYDINSTVVFYEMGEWYPVTSPGGVSRDFEKRDFTWGTSPPAGGVNGDPGGADVTKTTNSTSNILNFNFYNKMPIANGDVHFLQKRSYFIPNATFPLGYSDMTYMSMNQDKNNSAGIWEHNTGRPLVAYNYPPIQFTKPTQIRFGNKFLEDSVFVNINKFLDANQFVYPSEYGTIRRMVNTSNAMVESVGNILLVLGEEEAWSVYVNRTTLEDLSGSSQVSISDKVLGSYNTLLGTQGTLNPESAFKFNGRVIWWNAKKACWNRYSRDGITQISDIKLKNWFRDLATLLKDTYATSTTPWIQSIYDNYHDEWITRVDHSSLPGTFKSYSSYKCVSFAERPSDKRWKAWYDYAPDMFAQLDNEVYSMIGAVVHIHEAGTGYGSIYGAKYDSQIEFASTDQSRFVKDPIGVNLMATDLWTFDYIKGDWKSNSGTIQQTQILSTSLELKEGVYWSEIKKDQNSPNAGSTANGIVNGNPMKVKTLRIFMTLDPSVTYLSLLHWLSVQYRQSPKNPKN